MISQTTLANIRASLRTTEQLHKLVNDLYSNTNSNDLPWFCTRDDNEIYFREKGFFSELQGTWNGCLIESCQPHFDELFPKSKWDGVMPYPEVKILDTYEGSWIIDAALVIAISAPIAYQILKEISEIPDFIERINKCREIIVKTFRNLVNKKVIERVTQNNISKLPELSNATVVQTDIIIDARPMEALSPVDLCDHTAHIRVSVATNSITIENLSDEMMRNMRIGLFGNQNEQHRWNFGEAFVRDGISLSGHQTIAIEYESFLRNGDPFIIKDDYYRLDCWVQDSTGIYLFNFLLPPRHDSSNALLPGKSGITKMLEESVERFFVVPAHDD